MGKSRSMSFSLALISVAALISVLVLAPHSAYAAKPGEVADVSSAVTPTFDDAVHTDMFTPNSGAGGSLTKRQKSWLQSHHRQVCQVLGDIAQGASVYVLNSYVTGLGGLVVTAGVVAVLA